MFFSEMTILRAGFAGPHVTATAVFLAGLVVLFCGFAYQVGRIVLGPPRDEFERRVPHPERMDLGMVTTIAAAALAVVSAFYLPGPLLALIHAARAWCGRADEPVSSGGRALGWMSGRAQRAPASVIETIAAPCKRSPAAAVRDRGATDDAFASDEREPTADSCNHVWSCRAQRACLHVVARSIPRLPCFRRSRRRTGRQTCERAVMDCFGSCPRAIRIPARGPQ